MGQESWRLTAWTGFTGETGVLSSSTGFSFIAGEEVSMDGLRRIAAGSRRLEELDGAASGDAVWEVSLVDIVSLKG